jgi:hypothetical protein
MKAISLLISLTILLFSCTKEKMPGPVFSEARYLVEITGKWKQPEFGVPAGVHFTNVLGMVHDHRDAMWKENENASPGVESMAESGNPNPLLAEIDAFIAAGRAVSIVVIPAPPPTGSSRANIYCNSNYSCLSLETMLAPTPDWFTGISGLDLYANNRWITDTTIDLYAWDAGTEDGDIFSYNNPATVPQQAIHLLQPAQASVLANGNPLLAPIGTLRLIKQ